MNKPEKWKTYDYNLEQEGEPNTLAYNKVCDEWESYHRQEMKIALDHIENLEKEIEILKKTLNITEDK